MRTLIFPDVHERLWALAKFQERAEKVDRCVLLGDWLDTFNAYSEERVASVCQFIADNIEIQPMWDWLLGNHDCHYAFAHNAFKCSGYNPRTQRIVDHLVPKETWGRFKLFTRVGPYLVSHAGFNEATLQYAKPEVGKEAIASAMRGEFDSIFSAGKARGGWVPIGGPTWQDWNYEFEHIGDCPQIVGHTQGDKVRSKGPDSQLQSWCIDTSSRHIAIVDEDTGKVEIELL